MLRRGTSHPSLSPAVVEHPAGVMEYFAHLSPTGGELGPDGVDVGHDEVQPLSGARRGRCDPGAEDDRACRAWRCQLNHPEVRAGGVVSIFPPPERPLEVLGPVHVGDRHHDNLELHVHGFGSSPFDVGGVCLPPGLVGPSDSPLVGEVKER